eukprot:TRINITY_DN102_c0_g1_i1.p1 TRINITY_DN102_c0_g1~~TRINITY_DN102_c0_g1_i1.p1  ORF type:complete len:125 (-),score=42.44 TRINITY_DN102_c0_g1_i1:68-394(-)
MFARRYFATEAKETAKKGSLFTSPLFLGGLAALGVGGYMYAKSNPSTIEDMKDKAKSTANSAKHDANDAKNTIKDKAHEAKNAVADKAHEAKNAVVDKANEAKNAIKK